MSNITDWIKYTLYPSLYENIDRAFPEHNFTETHSGWRSNTYLDGSPHTRQDKTVVSKKAPGRILEQGGDNKSLVDYVIDRDGVTFIEAVKTLADVVGLQLPQGEIDTEVYQRDREMATLREDCNSYFIYCLGKAEGSKDVIDYLRNRGYSEKVIEDMELGYIPSQEQTYTYLQNKGYSQDLISKLNLNKKIGSTHKLSIPYRSGGSIKGFKFRAIEDVTPKYVNSTGLDKRGGFFNLSGIKGDEDVVVVEGELDSLSATARGVENVVAAGGSSISREQVIDAIKRGAKSFTVCFDAEPGKEQETYKNVNRAVGVIRGNGVNNVYIVNIPDLGQGKTDPDRYIREKGVDAFKDLLKSRETYGAYLGKKLLEEFLSKAKEQGEVDYKERDLLREKVAKIRYGLSGLDRVDFNKHLVEPLRSYGFTEEILTEMEESQREAVEEAQRNKKVQDLLVRAGNETGGAEAIHLLKEGLKDIDAITGKGLLPPPLSFDNLMEQIATIPPALTTGYKDLDSFVGFTPGAITLIAGRPAHGKTTFMLNLLLRMSRIYPDRRFYFFTYEEPLTNLYVKLINILSGVDLREYYPGNVSTNYEFIKRYIKDGWGDRKSINRDYPLYILSLAMRELQDLMDTQRIQVIDKSYSAEELYSLISYLNKREPIGAVFIDYIQRMRAEAKTEGMRTKIAHISDTVLQTAKDTGLPIILGAQLNRATLDSKEGKPKLDNLKEAGNLEEDANTVLSVYNESREKDKDAEGIDYRGERTVTLEIKALKNREGEVNRQCSLLFDKWTGSIDDTPPFE